MAIFVSGANGQTAVREPLTLITEGERHAFSVEIARTPGEQAKGLMFRSSMAADHGMLFIYEKPQTVTMWMRNTYIPLDMIFIAGDGTVHRIEPDTVPMSEKIISSDGDVTAVLELNAGVASRLGLKPGDSVEHGHFKR